VVELKPYGGVWYEKCNANFKISFTCDGPRKLSIRCKTEDSWKKEHREKADFYGTVIWSDDKETSWIAFKNT